jgi:hypothetical protein
VTANEWGGKPALSATCRHSFIRQKQSFAVPLATKTFGLNFFCIQENVSPIKVLNQVFICLKFPLVILAASVALAPEVTPPLEATAILRVLASYWYTAVSHDAVEAVIGE